MIIYKLFNKQMYLFIEWRFMLLIFLYSITSFLANDQLSFDVLFYCRPGFVTIIYNSVEAHARLLTFLHALNVSITVHLTPKVDTVLNCTSVRLFTVESVH